MNIVQIGTNNPNQEDEAYQFISDNAKSIKTLVLIEPLMQYNDKIRETYKHISNTYIENVAIFNEEDVEYKFLYTIKESVPDNYTEVSSFKISHLYAHKLEPDQIQKIPVRCTTLNKLFKKYNLNQIDVLFIDAEGFDLEIIKSINYETYDVRNILYEYRHIDAEEAVRFLRKKGYTLELGVGRDNASNLATKS